MFKGYLRTNKQQQGNLSPILILVWGQTDHTHSTQRVKETTKYQRYDPALLLGELRIQKLRENHIYLSQYSRRARRARRVAALR